MLLTPIFLVVIIGYSIYFTVKAGRDRHHGGKTQEPTDESAESDRFWVGGLFYYNKNDPTLFVGKRFGVGYTVNFGNRKVLIVLAALVLVILIHSL